MARKNISSKLRVKPAKASQQKDPNLIGGVRGGDKDAAKNDDHIDPPIVQRTP